MLSTLVKPKVDAKLSSADRIGVGASLCDGSGVQPRGLFPEEDRPGPEVLRAMFTLITLVAFTGREV